MEFGGKPSLTGLGLLRPGRFPVTFRGVFLVALVLRLAAALTLWVYSVRTGNHGFLPWPTIRDDRGYVAMTDRLLDGEIHGVVNAYPLVLAPVRWLFGKSVLATSAFTALLGSCAVVAWLTVATKVTDARLGNSKALRYLAATLIATPTTVLLASGTLKDALVSLLVAGALCSSHRALAELQGRSDLARIAGLVLISIVMIAAVTSTRVYLGLALTAGFLFSLVRVSRRLLAAVALLIPVWVLTSLVIDVPWIGFDALRPLANWERMETLREVGYAGGETSLGIQIGGGGPLHGAIELARSIFAVLVGPLPTQISGWKGWLLVGESVLRIALIVFGFLIRPTRLVDSGGRRDPFRLMLIVTVTVTALTIGLISDNASANMRLREMIFIPLMLLVVTARRAERPLALPAVSRWRWRSGTSTKDAHYPPNGIAG